MEQTLQKPKGFKRLWSFLKETRAELRKVTWPTRKEVTSTTLVVILSVFFFGFYLFFMDIIFSWIISSVHRVLHP